MTSSRAGGGAGRLPHVNATVRQHVTGEPGRTAIGTWSGGRYPALRRGDRRGAARGSAAARRRDRHGPDRGRLRRRARPTRCSGAPSTGVPRERLSAWSARSATTSTRASAQGPRGFPRFTDPRCAARTTTPTTCGWRPSAASSGSAQDRFDLLLLHNPDRTGYESEAVWDGDGGAARRGPRRRDRRRSGPGQRLHPRPGPLLRALRRPHRLGDGDPQPVRALARRALPRRGGPPRRPGDHPGRRLRRALLGRRHPGDRAARRATTAPSGPRAGSPRAARSSSGCGRSPSAPASRRCSSPASGTSPTPRSRAWSRR